MRLEKFPVCTTVMLILIFNACLTWYGRIYYPENFHPDKITFIENYFVLVGGEIIILLALLVLIILVIALVTEIKKEIKSWYRRKF